MVLCLGVGFAFGDTGAVSSSVVENTGDSPRWNQKTVEIAISDSYLNSQLSPELKREFESIVRKSFLKWSRDSGVTFVFSENDKNSVSSEKSGGDGVSLVTIAPTSENLLLFGEKRTSLSAVTRIFLDSRGNIIEADIVLNPTARFTRDGSRGAFDLESTLTHEAGHSLGLKHSNIQGATMNRHQGRNGIFGLPSIYARTLSQPDRIDIQNLYNVSRRARCDCGTVSGDLTDKSFQMDLPAYVWAESSETGKVVSGVIVSRDGTFSMSKLPSGSYNLFASTPDQKRIFELKEPLIVEFGSTTESFPDDFDETKGGRLGAFGFNGQVSNIAIPLEKGRRYLLSVAVRDVDLSQISIESSAPGIQVMSDSLALQYKSGELDVVGFEVSVSDTIKTGEYSLSLRLNGHLIGNSPGVVSIDRQKNSWYSTIF